MASHEAIKEAMTDAAFIGGVVAGALSAVVCFIQGNDYLERKKSFGSFSFQVGNMQRMFPYAKQ